MHVCGYVLYEGSVGRYEPPSKLFGCLGIDPEASLIRTALHWSSAYQLSYD